MSLRKHRMEPLVMLCVRTPKNLHTALRVACVKRNEPMDAMVIRLIEAELARLDAAERASEKESKP